MAYETTGMRIDSRTVDSSADATVLYQVLGLDKATSCQACRMLFSIDATCQVQIPDGSSIDISERRQIIFVCILEVNRQRMAITVEDA